MFYINPTTDFFISLISFRYSLNKKQYTITYALLDRILKPLLIQTVDDQLLLYLSSVGGSGKTYLIKAFIFRLSILEKQDNILLTASTGAAATNINSSTYHSALALYRNQLVGEATKSRLHYKKIFIVDEVSMISFKTLIQLDKYYNAIWDSDQENSIFFNSLPIIILLGDFN